MRPTFLKKNIVNLYALCLGLKEQRARNWVICLPTSVPEMLHSRKIVFSLLRLFSNTLWQKHCINMVMVSGLWELLTMSHRWTLLFALSARRLQCTVLLWACMQPMTLLWARGWTRVLLRSLSAWIILCPMIKAQWGHSAVWGPQGLEQCRGSSCTELYKFQTFLSLTSVPC